MSQVAWLGLGSRPGLWSSGPLGVNCLLPLPRKSACHVRNGWSGRRARQPLAPRRARGQDAAWAGLGLYVCAGQDE